MLVASYTPDAFQPWYLRIDENDQPSVEQTMGRGGARELPTTRCLDIPDTASAADDETEGSRVPLLLLGILASGLVLAVGHHVTVGKRR